MFALQCSWCPSINKCSTGTDRNRQDWVQRGCETSQIRQESVCPAIGTKGNNYGAEQTYIVNGTDVADRFDQSAKDASRLKAERNDIQAKSALPFDDNNVNPETVGFGMFLGLFLPILLVSCLAIWIFYAYRNPHTKSGQLLIQVSIIIFSPPHKISNASHTILYTFVHLFITNTLICFY